MKKITENAKNFGKLKRIYNTILSEGIVSKDNSKKKIFKGYISNIRENKILMTEFLVYTNIENKVETDINKAILFIKENIDLFSGYSKKEILEANANLIKPILFELDENYDKYELHKNITTLIFTEKNANNIDAIIEATTNIAKYIVDNKPKELVESIELPTLMIGSIMVDKYNERYASLDESEKLILKALMDSDEAQKKDVYSKTIRECIDLINSKLDTSDLEIKDRLLKVKDKLLNDKQDINEDFITNISKLVDLKNSLNN